jgi:predicted helicase
MVVFIDAKALSGFRISLEQEFDKIYIVNLRGNSRTRGDLNKKEGENIFKNGCRTTVVLTILVKKK